MTEELRAPLQRAFERLADDLTTGRHGDPHVAFVVLAFPDREPAVLVTRKDGPPYNLTDLRNPKKDEPSEGEPFPMGEFVEAKDALHDADLGFIFGRHGSLGGVRIELGEELGRQIAEEWTRRRMAPIERALTAAQHEADHPARCEKCKRRFRTDRGLAMHLARSRSCGADGWRTQEAARG